MHKLLPAAGIATALFVGSSALEAQNCLGFASFGAGSMRAGVEATFEDGANAYTGELAFGRSTGAFAGVNASYYSFDEIDESAFGVGGTAGLQFPIAAIAGAQICPVVSASYIFGPNAEVEGFDLESSTLMAQAGAAIGAPFQLGMTSGIVPFAAAALAHGRTSIDVGGESFRESDTYALLGIGAGLVLNQRITIRPTISIPVGLDDSDATFSIGAAINFGTQGQ